MAEKRIQIRINSNEKIEQILQEAYDLTCKQLNDIQNEMNKLSNSCVLADVTIDEKAKYAKAMHDFLGDREKIIARKFEIAKFMGEIMKHKGDVDETLNDKNAMKGFSMAQLKKALKDNNGESDGPATYELKRNNG